MAVPVLALPPKLLQPGPAPLVEPRLQRPVPLGPLPLDALTLLTLDALPLQPLSLESLRDRPAAPELDYVTLAATEPPRRDLPAPRSSIGDVVVPG